LNEGDYIDLFATSDGIINDSSAFVIEYLYTGKPQLFLANDETVSERFNEVGRMAILKHYRGMAKNDIEKFLDEIILEGNDYMNNERIRFFNTTIKPPNNITASENIYNCLKLEIFDIEN
jgi:CDP-glycerol glycerophosphotransferase (TagB/SpsB family)